MGSLGGLQGAISPGFGISNLGITVNGMPVSSMSSFGNPNAAPVATGFGASGGGGGGFIMPNYTTSTTILPANTPGWSVPTQNHTVMGDPGTWTNMPSYQSPYGSASGYTPKSGWTQNGLPTSAPSGFGIPSSYKQTNADGQAASGYVGGKTSGPANPYNNNQFANITKPTDVFSALKSSWDNIFNMMGAPGMKGAGVGFNPGGKVGNLNAAPPKSDLASFQNNQAGEGHGGLVAGAKPGAYSQLVSGDIKGQTPGEQLAIAINANVQPGKAINPAFLQQLKTVTPNVLALAMDKVGENQMLEVMAVAAKEGGVVPITPYRYAQFSEGMRDQVMDNPALAPAYREPYVDATKGVIDKALQFVREANLAARLSTKNTETIQIRIMSPDLGGDTKSQIVYQMNMIGYGYALDGEGYPYGPGANYTNAIVAAFRGDEGAQKSLAENGVTVTGGENGQYTITMPGPLYGTGNYAISSKSYGQVMDASKSFLGESGNPWSGNSQTLQMLEAARRVGNAEIGLVVKNDGTFTLGQRLQTVMPSIPTTEARYGMPYPASDYQGEFGAIGQLGPFSPTPVADQAAYTNFLTTAPLHPTIASAFNNDAMFKKVQALYVAAADGTDWNTWLSKQDWNTLYNKLVMGASKGGTGAVTPSSSYTPSYKTPSKRLRSVSY